MKLPTRILALLAVGGTAFAACGSDDNGSTSDSIAGSAPSPNLDTTTTASEISGSTTNGEVGTFPVTITHKYGQTTIDATPARVISVGFVDQDTILALGVTPVAVRDWYGDQPYAV